MIPSILRWTAPLLLLCLSGMTLNAQTALTFADENLERFLYEQDCVDLDGDGYKDRSADLNNDGVIDFEEAADIESLFIGEYPDEYFIESLEDLRQFPNLRNLQVIWCSALTSINHLDLDSLHTLWIADCLNLKYIDISDLPLVQNLRIEGCMYLDYLNIANGRAAFPFSLFYSEYIQYACVDSIAAEYNEVTLHMDPEGTLRFDCAATSGLTEANASPEIELFPNPASDFIQLRSSVPVTSIRVLGQGRQFELEAEEPGRYRIDHLPNGHYTLWIESTEGITSKSFLKVD